MRRWSSWSALRLCACGCSSLSSVTDEPAAGGGDSRRVSGGPAQLALQPDGASGAADTGCRQEAPRIVTAPAAPSPERLRPALHLVPEAHG